MQSRFLAWWGGRLWIPALLVPLAFYLLTLNGLYSSDYPDSILGMQFAMWSQHSFSLGSQSQLLVQSVDLAVHNGQYYSAISPGFAIISFPFAALGFILDGNTLNLWGHALLMDEAFLAFASSLAALFVYQIARFYVSPGPSLLASLTMALATPLWPSTTVIFIHGASLMFSTAAVYCLFRYTKGGKGIGNLLVSGLLLGGACFVEYAAALLVIPLAAYLALTAGRKLRVAPFLIAFSTGPLAQLAYNRVALGSPFIFPEALKTGAAGTLLSRFDFAAVALHIAAYIVSPYRGILFFSPVAALGIYSVARMAGSSGVRRLDAALFFSMFMTIVVTYSSWGDWAGGQAYGPRFLILGLPYLVLPLAILLEERPSRLVLPLFAFLFGLSAFIEGAGALTTGFSVTGGLTTFQPLALNIPWLLQGRLDTWWIDAFHLGGSLARPVVFTIATFSTLGLLVTVATGAGPRPMVGELRLRPGGPAVTQMAARRETERDDS